MERRFGNAKAALAIHAESDGFLTRIAILGGGDVKQGMAPQR